MRPSTPPTARESRAVPFRVVCLNRVCLAARPLSNATAATTGDWSSSLADFVRSGFFHWRPGCLDHHECGADPHWTSNILFAPEPSVDYVAVLADLGAKKAATGNASAGIKAMMPAGEQNQPTSMQQVT